MECCDSLPDRPKLKKILFILKLGVLYFILEDFLKKKDEILLHVEYPALSQRRLYRLEFGLISSETQKAKSVFAFEEFENAGIRPEKINFKNFNRINI